MNLLALVLPSLLVPQDAPGAPAAPAAPQSQLTDAELMAGWKMLFDGKSSAGWRGYKKTAFPTKGWVVEDGVLHVTKQGGGGDIVTDEEFTDFELTLEWKVAPGANSGIMYRVSEDQGAPWATGPEYQVLDDDKHPDGKDARTSAGSCYALVAGKDRKVKPVGEWNSSRILVRGNHVEHGLNGATILEYELQSPAFNALVEASKFKSMASFARMPKGRIALQDHGDDVWYRNIKVRPLKLSPDTGKEIALFNGKDMTGWTFHLQNNGKMEDVWSVTADGVIVCKGNPVGYIRTKDDFTNFALKLEWRFNPVTKKAGNSGVLLRMVGDDKVWPKSVEAQLMSENAGDFWCIDDFPMKTDPARTKGRNTKKLAMNERPLGEWNEYEITVDKGHVTLKVNGKVLNEATDVQEVPGKICLQSEGAEIHFRNIRLLKL